MDGYYVVHDIQKLFAEHPISAVLLIIGSVLMHGAYHTGMEKRIAELENKQPTKETP